MKKLILLAAIPGAVMAQSAYEIPSIEQMANQPILSRGAVVLPVAPISSTGPTTVWQSGNYTYVEEPRGTTTVFQAGNFTYITPPQGPQTTCQTIGKFTYCN
jgi:hypothetical protein